MDADTDEHEHIDADEHAGAADGDLHADQHLDADTDEHEHIDADEHAGATDGDLHADQHGH